METEKSEYGGWYIYDADKVEENADMMMIQPHRTRAYATCNICLMDLRRAVSYQSHSTRYYGTS
ncbi:hypothetical protein JG688_00012917 [Phytophthora aleatoria]|uniref:Uncharacterized protein n=1 Tax=Phytophthora aleatoria TaxID=2496075 RepID=A0A8J5IAI0_9STRA|nr:hypothetical protein JG688_00012917 [Phytophthora aleatoria]